MLAMSGLMFMSVPELLSVFSLRSFKADSRLLTISLLADMNEFEHEVDVETDEPWPLLLLLLVLNIL